METHKKCITVGNAWNSDVTIDYREWTRHGFWELSEDNHQARRRRIQQNGNWTFTWRKPDQKCGRKSKFEDKEMSDYFNYSIEGSFFSWKDKKGFFIIQPNPIWGGGVGDSDPMTFSTIAPWRTVKSGGSWGLYTWIFFLLATQTSKVQRGIILSPIWTLWGSGGVWRVGEGFNPPSWRPKLP